MEKDALHVFIVVRMAVAVAMIVAFVTVIMRVSMAMVSMTKGCKTNNVHQEA